MKPPFVSLIIVNYNGFEITKKCLRSIFQNTKGIKFEAIVVDNASFDGSVQKLRKIFNQKPGFQMVARKTNDFLAAAYNEGFKHSRGEIVIFMNNDLVFTLGWLKELLEAFKKKRVGVAGCAVLSSQQPEVIDNLGGKLNLLGFGRRISSGEEYQPIHSFREVFYIQGVLLAVRRSVYKKVGGFDQTYGGNYEDVDFCWRAQLLGYQVYTAKKSIIHHLGSWTVDRYFKKLKSSYLCRRNRLTTIFKNEGAFLLTISLSLNILFSILLVLKEAILDRDFKLAWQTPKAFWYILRNYQSLSLKRKAVQATRTISDWAIFEKMLNFNN